MRVESAFGIHIGNTNACLGVYKEGRSDVVANDDGDRTTPATVSFLNGGKEVVVGLAAKQGRFRNAKSTVINNKRLLLDSFDLSKHKSDPYAKVIHEAKTYKHNIHFEDNAVLKVTPDIIHQHLLKYIVDIAESRIEEDSKDVVITVPTSMSLEKRLLVSNCAKKAGFNLLQMISEPAAACLAYNLGQSDNNQQDIVLVYRVGGIGTEATLVRSVSGVYSILGSCIEDLGTGGTAISQLFVQYLANEFKRKYKLDPLESKRSVFKLENAAETVKHVLSTLDTAPCHIESLYEGIDFNHSVTRARFNNELSKLMPTLLRPIHRVLELANVHINKVNKVILCGGSCKIPAIQSNVSSLFPNAEILNTINPDEVIAKGAADQAALLTNSWTESGKSFSLKALCGSLIFSKDGEEKEVLIPTLTPIPVRKSHHFSNLEGNVLRVQLSLVNDQGENVDITELSLNDLEEDSKISLSAHIYRDGHLHLTLTDKKTNKCDSTTFEILS
ncbi:heat shock 70 kDa protein 14-B [Lepeophtheirus salmonis]|uniref:heat shock 70 kDa protein 14-B n=1 Tax=Lepeophtheirus salmonis TaxID=72036 RepID=UPI001AE5EFF1|nr:heat shock 70 kDa protein 14-B-like [Lepeophtheirus salmonis]